MNMGRIAPEQTSVQEPSRPKPALNTSLLFNDENIEEEDESFFMKRMYATTVDGPCHSVACSIEDQLDLLTHCRQPMHFLSFFREDGSNDGVGMEIMPAGMYMMPSYCEYCGATHTSQCPASCSRPKLFFRKRRPPFAKPDAQKWDPKSDEYIPPPPREDVKSASPHSWVSGFFRSTSK